MSWLLLAIAGHLSNAISFIIDKTLLSSTWNSSATYAALIGSLSALVVVASPWVHDWPTGDVWMYTCLFGATFVLSLWAFFEALRRAEASRIVPIVGSLNPLFTFIGSILVLHDQFSPRSILGFVLLLIATMLLAKGSSKSTLDTKTIGLAIIAALLFALSSLSGKYAFSQASFLGVLIVSRIAAAIVGNAIGILVPMARRELQQIFTHQTPSPHKSPSLALALLGQGTGSLGFVLVNLALAQGSAAFVNALQAVQYAAIVVVAWIGGKRLRTLLQEDVSQPMLLQKGFAIILVGLGLWLIAR